MRKLINHLLTSRMQTFSKKYWYGLCWQFWEVINKAAEDAFKSEIVETLMWDLEVDGQNISKEEFNTLFLLLNPSRPNL